MLYKVTHLWVRIGLLPQFTNVIHFLVAFARSRSTVRQGPTSYSLRYGAHRKGTPGTKRLSRLLRRIQGLIYVILEGN